MIARLLPRRRLPLPVPPADPGPFACPHCRGTFTVPLHELLPAPDVAQRNRARNRLMRATRLARLHRLLTDVEQPAQDELPEGYWQ